MHTKRTLHTSLLPRHAARARQWGTEAFTKPLSNLHERPSTIKIALSRLAIVLTVFFWLLYLSSVIFRQLIEGPQSYDFTMDVAGYVVVVTLLTFSALMYLVARHGALQRFSKHVRVPRALLDAHFSKQQPGITVLVPSYSEETAVIRKTLLSAALQEYPSLRVVLLLDDDESKISSQAALQRLQETRQLGRNISQLLSAPHQRFEKALNYFETHHSTRAVDARTLTELILLYRYASAWLLHTAQHEEIEDHVDVFFAREVLGELAKDLALVRRAIRTARDEGVLLSRDRVFQLYRRLVWIFQAEIEVFERKQFASLSKEANKAMNLNAYIGLMGGNYKKQSTPEGTILLPISDAELAQQSNVQSADILRVPNSEFILTLDADSILLRDYCLRLVHFLQQPDHANVAVTQTPYSSFRGAPTRIKRISGATTDIQHILHQGMSYYNATFWVGANAVIRKAALDDIAQTEWIGGFEVKRYIQDNTVIEDTESSIDLSFHSWRLVNYPERLSYSATPPDFGSLVVQRRRWANGGLLILPKLWEQLRTQKARRKPVTTTEFLLRLNYMASIAWSSFGLVFLLAYPYDGRLLSPLVLLAATPYFLAQASDLKNCRYHYSDIFRIYGFNLILLPVNIAGVLKSLQQALTTKKIPFARTPKVKNRTTAGLPFVIAPFLIIAFSIFTAWRNVEGENWGNAAFAAFNAITASWALVSYIGVKHLLEDIWLGATNWMYVEAAPKKQTFARKAPQFDWKGVLYHGEPSGSVPHHTAQDLLFQRNLAE